MDRLETMKQLRANFEEALERRDIATLRRSLEDGATFASFTIQCDTPLAEASFVAWKQAGRPDDVTAVAPYLGDSRYLRLQAVRALTDADILEIATLPSWEAEERFAMLTTGYGAPKASFSLACWGKGRIACLDSHLIEENIGKIRPYMNEKKKVSEKTGEVKISYDFKGSKGKKRDSRFSYYRQAVEAIYGDLDDTATEQWSHWLAQAYAEGTNHNCLLPTSEEA